LRCNFKVFRFDPSKDKEPYYRNYTVEAQPGDRILDCLNTIRWEQDPSLAFRWSCAHGVCGSDALKINGASALACQKLVKNYTTTDFLIEPIPVFPLLKDLIVDMEPFFKIYHSIKPYLISQEPPPETERIQKPEERKMIEDTIKCISCACCTSSCPVNLGENTDYIGPAALVKAHRYIFDSRDTTMIDRCVSLNSYDGAWGCKTYFYCTDVCPKSIKVTSAITRVKQEIVKLKRAKQL